MSLILVMGGARSGKSSYAEALAAKMSEHVAYIATAQAFDEEMENRILMHKNRRPGHWSTYESPDQISDLMLTIKEQHKVFLIDCLTLLISNILLNGLNIDNITPEIYQQKEAEVFRDLTKLVSLTRTGSFRLIIVTNELGLGIVPATPLSRAYRDLVGRANQYLAQEADQVIFTVAGMPLQIKPTLEMLEE
ncbi:MAG: bifunctional adenosylcobinamide kinase/adenosylcobinamide-phosphate guanylyltransferase [Peptococcaceae bacterium]